METVDPEYCEPYTYPSGIPAPRKPPNPAVAKDAAGFALVINTLPALGFETVIPVPDSKLTVVCELSGVPLDWNAVDVIVVHAVPVPVDSSTCPLVPTAFVPSAKVPVIRTLDNVCRALHVLGFATFRLMATAPVFGAAIREALEAVTEATPLVTPEPQTTPDEVLVKICPAVPESPLLSKIIPLNVAFPVTIRLGTCTDAVPEVPPKCWNVKFDVGFVPFPTIADRTHGSSVEVIPFQMLPTKASVGELKLENGLAN